MDHYFLTIPLILHPLQPLLNAPLPLPADRRHSQSGVNLRPGALLEHPRRRRTALDLRALLLLRWLHTRLRLDRIALARTLAERESLTRSLEESNARLEAADRNKNEFIAMLAHEPIRADVISAVRLGRRCGIDGGQRSHYSGLGYQTVSKTHHCLAYMRFGHGRTDRLQVG